MVQAEKLFLRANGNKQVKHKEYKLALKHFDGKYRKAKRQYHQAEATKLTETQTKNPKEFWQMLKNLGPSTLTKPFSNGVYCKDGTRTMDSNKVHIEVSGYFETLYNPTPCNTEFDETFYKETMSNKGTMEQSNHHV